MDRALYISMTGAKHNMLAQAAHSHNLANASTTGFKADFINAMSQSINHGDGLKTRAYAVANTPETNFAKGAMQETGRDLDVAVNGEGWMAVLAADGEETYTRTGILATDVFGVLRNEQGDQVLGNGGPIVIPEYEKIEIGADGTISIRALGQGPQTLVEIDRIKLVKPEAGQLEKRESGKLVARSGALKADASVRLVKGFIEGSNVNSIDELTSVVSLARQFELQVKMMQTIGDMAESSSRLLQVQA
jgi:flagellar basal-body rod protein FlgF